MSKPYEAHARHMTRKAWMCLGKAREARSNATMIAHEDWFREMMLNYSCDMAKCARSYSKQAVFYRQMNEVL